MRYHDYHLEGYEVRDSGGTIVLHLASHCQGQVEDESLIEFSGVAAYQFVHTGGAIITDLAEIQIGNLLKQVGARLSEWWHRHGGYPMWDDDQEKYLANLLRDGYRGWTIYSAIGFEGFVIAKAIAQKEPNNAMEDDC